MDNSLYDLGTIARAILAAKVNRIHPKEAAAALGASHRASRLVTKAGGGSIGDGDFGGVLSDWGVIVNAFFATLRGRSIFFRLLDSGFRRVPMRCRVGVATSSATGWIAGEGKPRAVSRFVLASPFIEPKQAHALIVITAAVASSMEAAATEFVNQELRGAVADVVDAEFFGSIIDTSTPSLPSAGPTAANMREDLRFLLNTVNTKGAGTLIWAMAPDVANAVSLIAEPRGEMTPIGGELLGLPAMVSHMIPAGTLRLIDAGSIGADADGIALAATNQASFQMADNPTNDATSPTATSLVSLWQTNSVGLMATVNFAVERARAEAIAEVTGIAWDTSAET